MLGVKGGVYVKKLGKRSLGFRWIFILSRYGGLIMGLV